MKAATPATLLARRLVQAPVYFYRIVISPLIGPRCRFQPTCSAYALEAIGTHGVYTGLLLTARRLSRCHPIKWLGGSEGFDPVPAPDRCRHHHATTMVTESADEQ